jgi:hypothetical protein
MAQESNYSGLVNKRAIPVFLLCLGLFFVFLSFFVGWYSVDAKLRRWAYDPENPPDYDGPFKPPLWAIDLEMKMLSISTTGHPNQLQDAIDSRGAPSYDEHAGRMGTVMLGVLLMQITTLIAFGSATGFFMLQRRRRHDYAGVTKRLFIVLFLIMSLSLAYFMVRIGPAAKADEEVILAAYPFTDQVAYQPLKPDLGFWKQWNSAKTRVPVGSNNYEIWQFEVVSNPSAGWWLTVAAVACAIGARVVGARNGDFDRLEAPEPPPAANAPAAG